MGRGTGRFPELVLTVASAMAGAGGILGTRLSAGPAQSGAPVATGRGTAAPVAQRPAVDGRGSQPQQPPNPGLVRWEWWNDADVKRQVGLSDDIVHRLSDIYTKRVKDMKPLVDDFTKENDRLNQMTIDRVADENVYNLQVTKVEALGARLRESRTMMLYRMTLALTPDQYRKLRQLMDAHFPGDGRGPQQPPSGR